MIRVRFPPSPTGPLHIGTVRAMLFNWLFARGRGGEIVFRSEDTDRERSTKEYEEEILSGLSWLGLTHDEGVYRQSEREEVYERYFEKLKEAGVLYPAYETTEELDVERAAAEREKRAPRYSGAHRNLSSEQRAAYEAEGRKPVWRVKVPEGESVFSDVVRGEIVTPAGVLDDFVVRKATGQFLYHFCVVVDDIEMGITHVIRGEDHISNTPKHCILFDALGATRPVFAHVPLLLNADRTKMSKRDASGKPMTLTRLREEGFFPEAIISYLAMLGWHPGGGETREIFSRAELVEQFSLERVQKGGAVFDLAKLRTVQMHYMGLLSEGEVLEGVLPYFPEGQRERVAAALPLLLGRLTFFSEAPALLTCFFERPKGEVVQELLPNEKMKVTLDGAMEEVRAALPVLEKLTDYTVEGVKEALMAHIGQRGIKNGQLLWPLRVVLTGERYSPGAFEMASALGKEETLARVRGIVGE